MASAGSLLRSSLVGSTADRSKFVMVLKKILKKELSFSIKKGEVVNRSFFLALNSKKKYVFVIAHIIFISLL